MLLNSDIEKKSSNFFQKEINVIMDIHEFFKNVNLNHFIWTKSQ